MMVGAPVNTKIPPVIQEIAYCEGVPNKYIRGFTGSVFQEEEKLLPMMLTLYSWD